MKVKGEEEEENSDNSEDERDRDRVKQEDVRLEQVKEDGPKQDDVKLEQAKSATITNCTPIQRFAFQGENWESKQ